MHTGYQSSEFWSHQITYELEAITGLPVHVPYHLTNYRDDLNKDNFIETNGYRL